MLNFNFLWKFDQNLVP